MSGLVYGIEERPPSWWQCLVFGWQHTLVDISPFVLPLAVAAALGLSASEEARLINFCLLAMGVATLIQTTLGNRLPIIQGPSATLTGTLAPVAGQLGGPAMWGGVFAGALVETALGGARLLTPVRRLFPPLVSGLVIVSIGISLGHLAVRLAVGDGRWVNFAFAGGVFLMVFLLQTRARGMLSRAAIFLSIWTMGVLAAGLAGEFDWSLVAEKPWFALPALFPFGGPGFGWTFAAAAVVGALAGYLGSIVESIGDYAATCQVTGEELTERHLNRGIFAEGLGCLAASALGGLPCTSYTQNVGIIASTRVASRLVVQVAAGILLLYGLCPKFGALLAAMPRPVLGGVFIIVCGMIVMSGLELLRSAPAGAANSLTAGTTLICALALPVYTQHVLGPGWLDRLPALLRLFLTNSVVLAVFLGVLLTQVLGVPSGGDAEPGGQD